MRNFFLLVCFSIINITLAQGDELGAVGLETKKEVKPSITLYKIYNLESDSTYVDTSLSIKSEYKYNLLRKDIFGLLPFSNEGHTYNTLDFGLIKKTMVKEPHRLLLSKKNQL